MARRPEFDQIKTRDQVVQQGIPDIGAAKKGSQCYRVGDAFYSYSTCIAVVDHFGACIVFNTTKYSTTTNRWASMLRYELPRQYPNLWVFETDPGTFNVTADQLLNLGLERHEAIGQDQIGDRAEDILGDDDVSMRRVYVNPYGYRHVRPGRSTLI